MDYSTHELATEAINEVRETIHPVTIGMTTEDLAQVQAMNDILDKVKEKLQEKGIIFYDEPEESDFSGASDEPGYANER